MEQEVIDQIDNGKEYVHYMIIEECGGFIWTMGRVMERGEHTPKEKEGILEDCNTMSEIQKYAVSKLTQWGVDPETASDRNENVKGSYWKWFKFWSDWHKNQLSDEQWDIVNKKMTANEDISEYLPKIKWNEI